MHSRYVKDHRDDNAPTIQEAQQALQHLINIADNELSRDDKVNPFVCKETLLKDVAEQCRILITVVGAHPSDFYADIIPIQEGE